jgi:hypothetical protein
MISKLLLMIPTLAILSGCSGPDRLYLISHQVNFDAPGISEQQKNADWYQCKKENISDSENGMSQSEEKMALQCMSAKGYAYTENGF